jgi:hypothetical protein
MEHKPIGSSRIRAAGYDPTSQVLAVEFGDGRVLGGTGVS